MSENPHRGQYDGWNDPPKLQYQANNTTGKTKLNLNKRVAFPLQQGTSVVATSKPTAIVQPSPSVLPYAIVSSQPPVAIVQPLMSSQTTPPPMRVPTIPVDDDEQSGTVADTSNQEDIRDYCLNTFQKYLSFVDETATVRRDEVQRRINLLSQMWLNNTLNISVHRKLLNIAKALDSKDFDEAIENHRALVVDHSNICVSWAPALRQIILTVQEPSNTHTTSDLTSTTQVTPAQPVVINPYNNILIPTITNNSISENNSGIEGNQSATSNVQHL